MLYIRGICSGETERQIETKEEIIVAVQLLNVGNQASIDGSEVDS